MRAGRAGLPPLALGAGLLLWGWQCQLLLLAVPMAVLVEAERLVAWRWRFVDRDFHRIADLSGIALVLVVIYQFDANGVRGIYGVLEWLPLVLLLLTTAQVYSTSDTVSYTALFISVRRAVARGRIARAGGLDMRAPCLVSCLVAATAGAERSPAAFWVGAGIVAWALWPQRSRRFSPALWAIAASAAIGLGVAGQRAVIEARSVVEPFMMEWFHEYLMARRDPYRAYTAMGRIGRLKLSDRIVLRVTPDGRPGVPPLLRTATYQTFSRNMWLARDRDFDPVASDLEGTRWAFDEPPPAGERSMTISTYMRFGKGLVPAPVGVTALEELPVDQVFRNRLGTIKVLRGPGHVEYVARYAHGAGADSAPTEADLSVPVADEAVVGGIVRELGLEGRPAREVMGGIAAYFQDGFRYSVTLRRPTRLPEPLHEFLLETRVGHCEFYASATVLMLRAAGIPARYVSGYSVQEWSELEEAYVVRRRHAHAWAVAWVDGAWRDFDTTPAIWAELEADDAPWWEGAYDLWSWLGYLVARWRWAPGEREWTTWALFALIPLTLVLGWRLSGGDRVRVVDEGGARDLARRRGLDSELLGIERDLVARGHDRPPGESLGEWLRRLERDGDVAGAGDLAREVLPLHYRYRFDPAGLGPGERERLRAIAARWRERYLEGAGGPGD